MENLNLRHRCYQYESSGILVYDPKRNGSFEPWMALLDLEQDFADYYRLQFINQFKISLMKPNWKAHITVFKGEAEYRPEFEQVWNERNGETFNFVYGTEFFWNKNFVWLNCYFPEYFELREKAGLTHEDNGNWGHITIGKFRKEEQIPSFASYRYDYPEIFRKY